MPDDIVKITARWDDDAGVWSASSDDVDGLAIEAKSREILIARLREVIPELLALNHPHSRRVDSQPPPSIELAISGRQSVDLVY